MKKLNLGAGDRPIDGYDNSFDIKHAHEAFPLAVNEASVDEIRASHLFEHFGHGMALEVLRDWTRALKPGGLLKLAVPDLEYIAHGYLAGRAENWQGYLSGGQTDASDVHRAQYDEPSLGALMRQAGLVGIHRWKGDNADCSTLPVSLNLAAWKPPAQWPRIVAVMSVPRLGFMDNFFCAIELARLRIPVRKTQGAFWGQCLTRSMQAAIAEGAEWILTLDYDSVFSVETVHDLMATALFADERVDALIPLQVGRIGGLPLMTVEGSDGNPVNAIDRDQLDATVMPVMTGHFGCTLIRVEALKRMAKPWFLAVPDDNGEWSERRTDEDIYFWHQWRKAGHRLHCAPRCVIGHSELNIVWPNRDLEAIHQHAKDYWQDGEPSEVWR